MVLRVRVADLDCMRVKWALHSASQCCRGGAMNRRLKPRTKMKLLLDGHATTSGVFKLRLLVNAISCTTDTQHNEGNVAHSVATVKYTKIVLKKAEILCW
jgi:hypothetical protein